MKHYFLFLLLLISQQSHAQSGVWTWMNGSNTNGATGNFGTIGVPSASNQPPARYQPAYWTDLQGNFWIFSGVSASNDLWKYDVATNIWTCIGIGATTFASYGTKGVPSPTNWPGTTGWGANCWTDHNGDLWLFGGNGNDATGTGDLNDLWRYNIVSNQWTWVSGNALAGSPGNYGTQGVQSTSNLPCGFSETKSSYVDLTGNLWMFGGTGTDAAGGYGNLNDLWRYNIANNQWTWVKGSGTASAPAVYGTLNVPAINNVPSGRFSYTKWVDQSGNFYVFSGDGATNDSWRYNPTTNQWTWIGGNAYAGDSGIVSGYCHNTDYPTFFLENRTVQTFGCGNFFWEFGGWEDLFGLTNPVNCLWFYDAAKNKWSLVSGAEHGNVNGSYGTMGVSAASNMIPGKAGTAMWMDNNANVWVFGGFGLDNNQIMNVSNDLWRYQPDTSCIHVSLSSFGNNTITLPQNISWCKQQDTTVNISGAHVISVTPNSTIQFATDSSHITFSPNQTTTYYITITGGCAGKDTQTLSFTINYLPQIVADFSPSAFIVPDNHASVTFTNTSKNATAYAWYYNHQLVSNSQNYFATFPGVGQYCITLYAFNAAGCADSMTQCITVVKGSGVTVPSAFSPNNDKTNDVLTPLIYGDVVIKEFKIYNRWGQLIFDDPTKGWDGTFKNELQNAQTVYIYYLKADAKNLEGNYETVELHGNVTLLK